MPLLLYKFGEFELDCARFELRRDGRPLKLERIPMELLLLLAEKDGNLVTRQEIVERLWGKGVHVDTEHGINTAVRKVRAVLGEDAEKPRYVETVPGKGYRFAGKAGFAVIEPVAPLEPVNKSEILGPFPVSGAPVKLRRPGAIAMVGLAVGLAAIALAVSRVDRRLFAKNQLDPIRSIAVLPLANLSGDASQDYFSDGMTDELITALARNRSLRVVSRTSVMQYKGVNKPVREIAQALGVDGVLEGSISRAGNRVHVNLQLIYPPTDTHVWAESYDRDPNGTLSLPEELAQTIAMQAKAGAAPPGPQRSVNPEAHDAYLRGRYLWTEGNNAESLKSFEKARELQSDYAPAWSGISMSILAAGSAQGSSWQSVEQAEAAARKAVELDDAWPEGHHALAAAYFFGRWDWPRADAEVRRAIELDPNYSEAHHLRAYILFAMNRMQESLDEQKLATAIDPFVRPWALGREYYKHRQYDAALEDFRMRAQAGPDSAAWVHDFLASVYGYKGMEKEWMEELTAGARIHGGDKAAAAIKHAYEHGGRRAVLELQLNDLKSRGRKEYVDPFDLAKAYAALGMKDEALQQLEESYRVHAMELVLMQGDPEFDFLHSNERYQALLKNVGLAPAS